MYEDRIGFDNSELAATAAASAKLTTVPSSTGKHSVLFFFLTYLTIERSQQIALTEYQCVHVYACMCGNYRTCLYLSEWFSLFSFGCDLVAVVVLLLLRLLLLLLLLLGGCFGFIVVRFVCM